jgi:hypothetical protein
MWYNAKVKEYADITYEINKRYCDKYGHTLIRSDEKTYNHRPAQWERLPLMLKHIRNFDYVMWIDADAHFYNDAPDIMEVVKASQDRAFIFSGDVEKKHDYELNSGVFIAKNCPESIHVLSLWAYSNDIYQNRYGYFYKGEHHLYNDQGALQYMYDKNIANLKNISMVLNYGVLQHFVQGEKFNPRPFIFHMAGYNVKERVDNFKNYLDRVV